MHNKILTKLSFIVILFIVLILQSNISAAKQYTILREKGWFCNEHGASFPGASQGMKNYNHYLASTTIFSSSKLDDGKKGYKYNPYKAYLYYKVANSFHGGAGHVTTAQKYVWGTKWAEATNYANQVKGSVQLSPKESIRSDMEYVGPFKLANTTTNITNITVYDINDNVIDPKYWEVRINDPNSR